MNDDSHPDDRDRTSICSALAAFAEAESVPFDESTTDPVELGRRLKNLGWDDVDLIEATMDIDRDLQEEWFNQLGDAGALRTPNTFLLTWNPARYAIDQGEYDELVERTSASEVVHDGNWSTGVRKSGIEPGDWAFLVRQRSEPGIVAWGVFTSEIYESESFDETAKAIPYADVSWARWLPIEDRLPTEELKDAIPGVAWQRLQGSGIQVPEDQATMLLNLWLQHLTELGDDASSFPDEVEPGLYPEGATKSVRVNRFERSAAARSACLAHWGTRCVVCDSDFAETYGQIGTGFIHVHHTVELSTVDEGYEVNPIEDLRPVCPNCHAMLHRSSPPLTVEELRSLMQSADEVTTTDNPQ